MSDIRLGWEDEGPVMMNLIVHVDDDPIASGLLDADGNKLCVHREPVGFCIVPRPRYRVRAGREVIA